jgi:hypothetical protein
MDSRLTCNFLLQIPFCTLLFKFSSMLSVITSTSSAPYCTLNGHHVPARFVPRINGSLQTTPHAPAHLVPAELLERPAKPSQPRPATRGPCTHWTQLSPGCSASTEPITTGAICAAESVIFFPSLSSAQAAQLPLSLSPQVKNMLLILLSSYCLVSARLRPRRCHRACHHRFKGVEGDYKEL